MNMPDWKCRAADSLSNSDWGKGEILHELARKLDRVPLEARRSRDARPIDPREEVVEAMSGLVQERQHIRMR